MAIVTISRGPFSGGALLAECISTALGYRCIARDSIVQKAAAYGAPEAEIRKALDRPSGPGHVTGHETYVYLTLVQAALTEELRRGRAVYHGNAGQLLLTGVRHVLRIWVIAPLEFRVSQVTARLGLTREAAVAYLENVDRDARRWVQYLYAVDPADPGLYDLVLNLQAFTITQACDVLVGVLRERCFLETVESRAAMDDLAVASLVRARLAVSTTTSDLEVEIVARRGEVSIGGRLLSREQLDRACAVALAVPGVVSVDAGVKGRIAV